MKQILRNVAGMMAALALLADCATTPSPDAVKSDKLNFQRVS
jgi:hypothetical protein